MKVDLSSRVTVFVTTVGDKTNFDECLAALRAQTTQFRLEIIENVAPMSAAFQRMHDRCTTEYYVQVDEDMLLAPRAVEILFDLMHVTPPDVAMVCAPLWDVDGERPILGVKIYRHAIVRLFPYADTLMCEIDQMSRFRAAGYKAILLPVRDRGVCIGEHGKHYTPRTIFIRWQRLLQKYRRSPDLAWVEPWPRRLLDRYRATGKAIHLYAHLGAVSGLAGELPADKELDFRAPCPEFDRLVEAFGVEDVPVAVAPVVPRPPDLPLASSFTPAALRSFHAAMLARPASP